MEHLSVIKQIMHRYVLYNKVEFFAHLSDGKVLRMKVSRNGKLFIVKEGEIRSIYKFKILIETGRMYLTVSVYSIEDGDIEISKYSGKEYVFIDIDSKEPEREIEFLPDGHVVSERVSIYGVRVRRGNTSESDDDVVRRTIAKYLVKMKDVEYAIIYYTKDYSRIYYQVLYPAGKEEEELRQLMRLLKKAEEIAMRHELVDIANSIDLIVRDVQRILGG